MPESRPGPSAARDRLQRLRVLGVGVPGWHAHVFVGAPEARFQSTCTKDTPASASRRASKTLWPKRLVAYPPRTAAGSSLNGKRLASCRILEQINCLVLPGTPSRDHRGRLQRGQACDRAAASGPVSGRAAPATSTPAGQCRARGSRVPGHSSPATDRHARPASQHPGPARRCGPCSKSHPAAAPLQEGRWHLPGMLAPPPPSEAGSLGAPGKAFS